MSLILDALQRSQEEREQGGRAPGLAVQHHDLNSAAGRSPLRWLPWAGLVLALGAVTWLLVDRWPPQAVVPQAVVPEAVVPHAVVQEAVVQEAVVPEPASPEPAAASAAAAPAGDGGPASTAAARSGAPPAPAADRAAATGAGPAGRMGPDTGGATDAAVTALYRSAGRASGGGSSAASGAAANRVSAPSPAAASTASGRAAPADGQALDVDRLVQAAQAELVRAEPASEPVQEHSAPLIADLSQASKDAIPTLIYTGHDYTGGPDSAVMINNRRVRAGESAGAGVKVEEVLENSVVLNYRGTRFRLRALNSWVNL